MINVNFETAELTAEGTLEEIITETLCIIGGIYKVYRAKSLGSAELFKGRIISQLNDNKFWDTVVES